MGLLRSGQNLLDDLSMHVRQAVVAALIQEGQSRVIDAQALQDRRVQVVHMHGIRGDVVAEFVGRAVGYSGLDAAAGHPDGEAPGMMVPPVVGSRERPLAINCTAEFASPDDQRIFEQSTLLEIN